MADLTRLGVPAELGENNIYMSCGNRRQKVCKVKQTSTDTHNTQPPFSSLCNAPPIFPHSCWSRQLQCQVAVAHVAVVIVAALNAASALGRWLIEGRHLPPPGRSGTVPTGERRPRIRRPESKGRVHGFKGNRPFFFLRNGESPHQVCFLL